MKSSSLFLWVLSAVNLAACTNAATIAKVPDGDSGVTRAPDAGHDTGVRADGGAACATSADCVDGGVCGYPELAGCAAHGTCFTPLNPGCTLAAEAACACDGTEIAVGPCGSLPSGYASKPLAYLGTCSLSCPGSGDGGVGSSCTSTSECGTNELCAWPMSASCSVSASLGKCVAMAEGCHCIPPAACGCDGMPAETGCSASLPMGYSLSPFAHPGACVVDAGSCIQGDGNLCDAGAACSTTVNSACEITTTVGTGAPPSFSGGTIADGIYTLTSVVSYGGAGAEGQTQRVTMSFAGGGFTLVQDSDAQCNAAPTASGTFTTLGDQLTLTTACPGVGSESETYTATPSSFSYSAETGSKGSVVFTFTKQ